MVPPHATPPSSNGRPANRLLRQLPDEDFARIRGSLTTVAIKSKRPLYGRGEPITEVIFMNGGVASVTVAMSDGMLVEVGTIGDEGVVGLDAVFGGGLSHAECMVQIPGPDALAMPLSVVKAELARQGPLCESLHRYSAGLFALIMQSAACMALHDVPARCARWLLLAHDRTHTDAFELSHEFLAMMLGARRPTVSIAAGALQHAGFIRYHHGRITILDRTGLEAAACECYAEIRRQFEALGL